MIISNSVLHGSLAIHYLMSSAISWNTCYISPKKEGLDFLKCRQKAQMNAISRQVKFSVVVFLAVPSHLNKFTLLRKSLDIYYDYY